MSKEAEVVRAVDREFRVTHDSRLLRPADPQMASGVRVVMADADTGSQYTVVVSAVGPFEIYLGAPLLVTVVLPWQAAYALQPGPGVLTMDYVIEKFGRRHEERIVDLWSLTRLIAYALDREPYCPLLAEKEE